jgi:hypothetical protein
MADHSVTVGDGPAQGRTFDFGENWPPPTFVEIRGLTYRCVYVLQDDDSTWVPQYQILSNQQF